MTQLKMSRRSFLKLSAATAAAAGALSAVPSGFAAAAENAQEKSGEIKRVRTGCRGCGKMECGVIAVVQDGKVIRMEGDPTAFQSMGNCCTKSQSAMQAAYHPDRLRYPLKRTNDKESDDPGWVRISWDEAISTVVSKFNELQAKYGGESLFGMCGTSRVWCMFGASNGMYLWDSPNIVQAWQICKGPRHFATMMVSSFTDSWMETVGHPDVYVAWGGASEMSNYDDSCRTTVDVATRAKTHICVDPRETNMGKEGDYQLHLRPGTDGAMALAWTNVVIENDLYDSLFTKKWTDGPFLVVEDLEPSGWTEISPCCGVPFEVKTKLLKESDLVEGGSPQRFMVWDNLNNKLTYFDASTSFWEGETWAPATAGKEAMQENLAPGFSQGFVLDPTGFGAEDGFATEIDPALFGEFQVTLKDGSAHTAVPVFQKYAERAAEYTPEVVSEICGVPAESIRDAALAYATRLRPETGYGNGGIQYMLAVEHANTAIQNSRALNNLSSICGNYDTPGGNRHSTKAPIEGGQFGFANNGSGMPMLSPGQMDKLLGNQDIPLLKWWGMWSDATTVYNAVLTGEPYPVVGAFNSSGNFMHQCNSDMAWDALKSLDFYVENNLWHTPGGTVCDIKMPAAHFLELNSPRTSQGASGAMGATIKCIDPPGEAKFDGEIIEMLYKEKGVPYNVIPVAPEYPTIDQMLDMSVMAFEPQGWEKFAADFQEHGWWDCKEVEPDLWGTYRRYQTGAIRGRTAVGFVGTVGDWLPGFYTPTKKVEIWSTVMESFHPEGQWNLPTYTEPPHSPVSDPEMFAEYPLIITTGRRIPVYFHSEHRQLPWCRELWPAPRVEINPDDAKEYGIEQGDWVWIETPWGKIREVADLYYGVRKGTINCEHQWWFPELEQNGKGHELCAVNHLIDPWARDPHCGASNLRAYLGKIYKATPENSPFNNPVPCGHDGTEIIHDASDPRLKEWLPVYEGREA
ncbi:molybdopterin-containing oxidoreductase family protein [Parvibacter caecicola]|uniref:Anaerobic selenocysteine-containing dehydrogenase n=1 Tax=Parvibacter caecicola TaxID=747645 RepID=A0A7W5D0U8_9ACTN|nr:molybdopterin dinucleotide binding domain-containing protein [Parvibacter caecicola]MBB3170843.1 anaerobic selenocysteine-containing dehydrogenase [Parvibacter caecicola]MCR2042416.1 molybdopterin-dependent oxidoreductase [Parvibacter caecicola]RNL09144.1 molybdopterin dinucleotide-binding protein [Parvibacter caecicola]